VGRIPSGGRLGPDEHSRRAGARHSVGQGLRRVCEPSILVSTRRSASAAASADSGRVLLTVSASKQDRPRVARPRQPAGPDGERGCGAEEI